MNRYWPTEKKKEGKRERKRRRKRERKKKKKRKRKIKRKRERRREKKRKRAREKEREKERETDRDRQTDKQTELDRQALEMQGNGASSRINQQPILSYLHRKEEVGVPLANTSRLEVTTPESQSPALRP